MGDWRADFLRQAFEVFRGERDRADVPGIYHQEYECDVGDISAAVGRRIYHGREGAVQFFDDTLEVFPDFKSWPEEMRVRDDGAVLVRAVGRTSAGGPMATEMNYPPYGLVCEFRDGLIRRAVYVAFPQEGWEEAQLIG